MMDFAVARRNMVEGQLRTNQITDPAIISAMLDIPRERFVPAGWESVAYADTAVPLGAPAHADERRAMMEPLALARLLQAAEIRPDDAVLHVACNTGYATAVLLRLAAAVTALEADAGLAAEARTNLAGLALDPAVVVEGPLAAGLPRRGPYDVILIEGGVERVPEEFAAQLADEGRLVTIVSGGAGQGQLFRRAGGRLSGFPRFTATAPVLAGFEQPAEFVF